MRSLLFSGLAGVLCLCFPLSVSATSFIRGDVNQDGRSDVADVMEILQFHYYGHGDPVYCLDAADVDDNGAFDITDVVFFLEFLFRGRATLPAPFPDCGRDPSPDGFACFTYGRCAVADGVLGVEDYAADTGAAAIAAADLDGDGQVDLAVANATGNNVSVLLNRGAGTFSPPSNYPSGRHPRKISATDLNRDGRIDLVVSNRGAPSETGGSVTVLFNLGEGRFPNAHVMWYPIGMPTWGSTAGDVNGDGFPDIIAVGGAERGFAAVLLNEGDGRMKPPEYYEAERASYDVALGDVNRDGRADLVVCNVMATSLSVMFNRGDGRFARRTDSVGYRTYDLGLYPTAVALGDFNSDGDLDIAAVNGFPGELKVYLNRGRGIFHNDPAAIGIYELGKAPTALAVGDIDLDGDQDLVVATATDDRITPFVNRGNGHFGRSTPAGVGKNPKSVVLVDLDGDGDRDFAVANGNSDRITVLLNGETRAPARGGAGADEGR